MLAGEKDYAVTHVVPTHRPYENYWHHLQREFLTDGYDWLVHFDADNPPTRNPLDLIGLGLDVVACPTPVWHCDTSKLGDRPWYFNALDWDEARQGWTPAQDRPGFAGGLVEVDAVGSGCLVIQREVLASISGPFFRTWRDDGTVLYGGDYSFCRRAKAAGFRIWAHFGYLCEHFVEIPLLEAIGAIGAMSAANAKLPEEGNL